jgi:hypothetical protein
MHTHTLQELAEEDLFEWLGKNKIDEKKAVQRVILPLLKAVSHMHENVGFMFSLLLQKLLLLTCAKDLQILLPPIPPFLIWRKSCLLFSLKYLKSLKSLHFHLIVSFRK